MIFDSDRFRKISSVCSFLVFSERHFLRNQQSNKDFYRLNIMLDIFAINSTIQRLWTSRSSLRRLTAPLRSKNWQIHVPSSLPLTFTFSHLPAFFSCFTSFGPAAARGPREARETRPLLSLSLFLSFLSLLYSLLLTSRDSLVHPLFFLLAKDLWISIATKSKPLITPVGTPILISCLFF